MIVEAIFNVFFTFVNGLLSLLPDIDFDIPDGILTNIIEAFDIIAYIVPFGTVFTILAIVISLHSFRIIISLLKTLWDILPFV